MNKYLLYLFKSSEQEWENNLILDSRQKSCVTCSFHFLHALKKWGRARWKPRQSFSRLNIVLICVYNYSVYGYLYSCLKSGISNCEDYSSFSLLAQECYYLHWDQESNSSELHPVLYVLLTHPAVVLIWTWSSAESFSNFFILQEAFCQGEHLKPPL